MLACNLCPFTRTQFRGVSLGSNCCRIALARRAFACMTHSISVWRIALNSNEANHARLCACLDADERLHAAQFKSAADRRSYEICHGAVRHILAEQLHDAPDRLVFFRPPSGKPELHHSRNTLLFNLSHSANVALLAVSETCEVGVDVEYLRPLQDWRTLVHTVCTTEECAIIAEQPNPVAAFYRCWVGKEALLKCLGIGLSVSPTDWQVLDTHAQLRPIVSRSSKDPDTGTEQLTIRSLEELPSGYMGAVAAGGQGVGEAEVQVRVQDWGF